MSGSISDPMLGKLLDHRYRLEQKIGEGGMGSIYKAIHTEMGRTCAIKLLTAISTTNEDAIARFKREAKMASRIDNPHAVTIYDFGEGEDGLLFLAMEFIDGRPLSRLIAEERVLSIERVVRITSQVAEGLAAAHAMEIVHRDLKPDNIMITRKGGDTEYVKVLDFGIAKTMTEDAADNLTKTGFVLGTPFYMSPEQLLGEKLDPRSDIYSLAIIVYEMLSGKLPFVGDNPQAVMMKRITGEPIPLSAVAPTMSEAIEQVVMGGLARDRENRIQTVQAFASALRSAVHGGTQFIGMRGTVNLGGESGDRSTMEWSAFSTEKGPGTGYSNTGSSTEAPHTAPMQQSASTVESTPAAWPATQIGTVVEPPLTPQNQGSRKTAPQTEKGVAPPIQPAPPPVQPAPPDHYVTKPAFTPQPSVPVVGEASIVSEPEQRSRAWLWAVAAFVAVAIAVVVYLVLPRSASGFTLTVKGVPAGSEVYVNDQRRDATQSDGALKLSGLGEGPLAIRISRDGYAEFNTTLTGKLGEEKSIEANLLPLEFDYSGQMVLILAGESTVGDDTSKNEIEKPAYKVSLPNFYIDKYEVTNEQFKKFCENTGAKPPINPDWDADYFESKPDSPVLGVTWNQAKDYAAWAGKRLPTEEEWEKAASWDPVSKRKLIWPWGNMDDASRANIGTGHSTSVKQYAGDQSPYGVYGMAGNAWEWVDSFFNPYKDSKATSQNFGQGYHVVKGGCFLAQIGLDQARTASRDWLPNEFPPNKSISVGIRCAISADDPRVQQRLRQPGK